MIKIAISFHVLISFAESLLFNFTFSILPKATLLPPLPSDRKRDQNETII